MCKEIYNRGLGCPFFGSTFANDASVVKINAVAAVDRNSEMCVPAFNATIAPGKGAEFARAARCSNSRALQRLRFTLEPKGRLPDWL